MKAKVACLVLVLGLSAAAFGDSLTVGTTYNYSGALGVSSTQAFAQGFIMPFAGLITNIDVFVDASSDSQYRVWLTNQIGTGTTQDNVLATWDFAGDQTNNTSDLVLPFNTAVTGGQYFIILSATAGNIWWYFGSPNVGQIGSTDQIAVGAGLNSAFIPGSNFYQYSNPLTFQVYDDPVAPVPEPTSMALLGGGLVTILARRRKK